MEREIEDNRWKALLEATREAQRVAYHAAGTIAAWIINVNLEKGADPLTAADIFPFLKDEKEQTPAELTTEQTVDYLRRGFNVFIPERYR